MLPYLKPYLKFAFILSLIRSTVRVIGCKEALISTSGNSSAHRLTTTPILE